MNAIAPVLMVPLLWLCIMGTPIEVSAETADKDTKVDVCANIKQLVDKVATVILNEPSDRAFDEIVKNILGEFCTLRKNAGGSPESLPMVEALTAAVLGWAWDVCSLMTFKAQRNESAADIAAKSLKRRITGIQTLCPAIMVPDLAGMP